MASDSRLPSLAPLGAPSSPQTHTTLSIDGSADVNNMKIANPPDCSVPPVAVVHTPKPTPPSLQALHATFKDNKPTLRTHAYSGVGVIKPGSYSRSILRSATSQKLNCVGCTASHSLGIDNCHKHDGDKYGKGPHKRQAPLSSGTP